MLGSSALTFFSCPLCELDQTSYSFASSFCKIPAGSSLRRRLKPTLPNTTISTNAPIAPRATKFPPELPPRTGAAPFFGGGTGLRDVVMNATLNGTAVPGVVTLTLGGVNVQVVCNGRLPGQMKFTVPVKILSGTSCSMNVPVSPAFTEISVSCPLAKVIW
jgi:hypothetical protein